MYVIGLLKIMNDVIRDIFVDFMLLFINKMSWFKFIVLFYWMCELIIRVFRRKVCGENGFLGNLYYVI